MRHASLNVYGQRPYSTALTHKCIRASKVWGIEHIITTEEQEYCMKLMEVYPGAQCSLHFHSQKDESFLLIQGKLTVQYYLPDGNIKTVNLTPYEAVSIPKNTPHTFSAPEDQEEPSLFVEASTYDSPYDSYRLTKSQSPVK